MNEDKKMITLQREEVRIVQMMVACIEGMWMVGGLDEKGMFHGLNEEEISQDLAEVIVGLQGTWKIQLGSLGEVKTWVNEKIEEILNPDML